VFLIAREIAATVKRSFWLALILVSWERPSVGQGTLTMSLANSRNACRIVNLPAWAGVGEPNQPWWPGIPGYSNPEFSFRILSGRLIAGIEKTLISPELFTESAKPESPIVRPEKYAIDLDRGTVRKANDEEWQQARPVPVTRRIIGLNHLDKRLIGDKQVGVKRKKKKAREFQAPGMAISGTSQFITLDSWDGELESGVGSAFDPSFSIRKPKPAQANMYAEVYDLKSAALIFMLRAHLVNGASYLEGFRLSGWLGDRYYILPLDPFRLNQFVLCDMERVSSDKQVEWKPLELERNGEK